MKENFPKDGFMDMEYFGELMERITKENLGEEKYMAWVNLRNKQNTM